MGNKIDGSDPGAAAKSTTNIASRIWQNMVGGQQKSAQTAISDFAQEIQNLSGMDEAEWEGKDFKKLDKLALKAMDQAGEEAQELMQGNKHAVSQARKQAQSNMRKLAQALNPPPDVLESEEFAALSKKLGLRRGPREDSSFSRGSNLTGKVKADVRNATASAAVEKADVVATRNRVKELEDAGASEEELALAKKSFGRSIRELLRKKRKQEVKQADVEDVAVKTLGTMEVLSKALTPPTAQADPASLDALKALREEIVPAWKPDSQPWLKHATMSEVYDTALAASPKELFSQTSAWDKIQDLRAGQAVLAPRAEGRIAEAVSRNK